MWAAMPFEAPITSLSDLTEKQQETIRLLAEGLTAKEIAARLEISHSAVAQRIETLRSKFGGITKNELARKARGWLAAEGYQADSKPFMLAGASAANEPCMKDTGQKNHLPHHGNGSQQGDGNQFESELRFSDSFVLDATPPWDQTRHDRLVPEVLDGEHAAPARWAYIVGAAIGMAILLLVLLAVANALGELA